MICNLKYPLGWHADKSTKWTHTYTQKMLPRWTKGESNCMYYISNWWT